VVGRFWIENFYQVPPPEGEDYLRAINRVCHKESIDVVIPQTTRETAKLSQTYKGVDAKVLVSGATAIEQANNKYSLLKICENLGIPVPKSQLVKSTEELQEAAKDLGYPHDPVVVKPPVSWGSRGFRVLREGSSWNTQRFLSQKPNATEISLEELVSILSSDGMTDFPELMVSEFLPGDEYTVDAFVGEKVSVAIPRLRKEIVNGISFRTSLEYQKDIMENSLKLAGSLGLRFAVGFQFKLDSNGIPKILECNPRVQGTMAASLFSGANVIWMAVREVLGIPIEKLPKPLKKSEFYRYWGGVALTDGRPVEI
jgi:carbamoyl-phosphate synthase large subunit